MHPIATNIRCAYILHTEYVLYAHQAPQGWFSLCSVGPLLTRYFLYKIPLQDTYNIPWVIVFLDPIVLEIGLVRLVRFPKKY